VPRLDIGIASLGMAGLHSHAPGHGGQWQLPPLGLVLGQSPQMDLERADCTGERKGWSKSEVAFELALQALLGAGGQPISSAIAGVYGDKLQANRWQWSTNWGR